MLLAGFTFSDGGAGGGIGFLHMSEESSNKLLSFRAFISTENCCLLLVHIRGSVAAGSDK
jgi:hypothetical protein